MQKVVYFNGNLSTLLIFKWYLLDVLELHIGNLSYTGRHELSVELILKDKMT